MNNTAIKIVRIYITEGDDLLHPILEYLHHTLKVHGATVFRAISGFGESGTIHESKLLTMSLNLPLVVEFFDTPDQIQTALNYLSPLVGKSHIVSWDAAAH